MKKDDLAETVSLIPIFVMKNPTAISGAVPFTDAYSNQLHSKPEQITLVEQLGRKIKSIFPRIIRNGFFTTPDRSAKLFFFCL